MGIPNQVERLKELREMLIQLKENRITIDEILDKWWIRQNLEGYQCKRCLVMLSVKDK